MVKLGEINKISAILSCFAFLVQNLCEFSNSLYNYMIEWLQLLETLCDSALFGFALMLENMEDTEKKITLKFFLRVSKVLNFMTVLIFSIFLTIYIFEVLDRSNILNLLDCFNFLPIWILSICNCLKFSKLWTI